MLAKPSFRGYADYMQTPDFASNIKVVLAMAASGHAH